MFSCCVFANSLVEEDLSVRQGAADLVAIIIVIMTWFEGLQELTDLLLFRSFDFKMNRQT